MENDPSYLLKAASKADHADTFIMERYEEELGKNIEIDAPELEEEVSLAGESHDMVSASEHQTESEMPEPALAAILKPCARAERRTCVQLTYCRNTGIIV